MLDGSAGTALRLAVDLPRLRIHGEVWRRIGPRTWLVDFAVDGGEAAETASILDARARASDVALGLRAADARARVAAFATAEDPDGALEIVPLRRDRTRLVAFTAGASRRCRAVLVMPEGAPGVPSDRRGQLEHGRQRRSHDGAPAPAGPGTDQGAPSGGASVGSDAGSSK